MTETDWLKSNDPVVMLSRLNRPPGDRLLQLYGVACCRKHWNLMSHKASRQAVEWAERYADGLVVRDEEFGRIEYYSEGAAMGSGGDIRGEDDTVYLVDRKLKTHVAFLAHAILTLDESNSYDPSLSDYRAALSVPLIHEIFGNPFRRISLAPHWLTENVLGLARTIYEDRCFDRLPILADALMDAGCFDDEILNHCRSEGPHVRGCWVIDLLLGKQ